MWTAAWGKLIHPTLDITTESTPLMHEHLVNDLTTLGEKTGWEHPDLKKRGFIRTSMDVPEKYLSGRP